MLRPTVSISLLAAIACTLACGSADEPAPTAEDDISTNGCGLDTAYIGDDYCIAAPP